MAARVRGEDNLPPNASGEEIAKAHGYRVAIDSTLPSPWGGHIDVDERVIWVKPAQTPAKLHFVILHELSHSYLSHLKRGRPLEACCQRGAAALMMPKDPFLEDCRETGRDIKEMSIRWPNSSREALVARIAELTENTVAAAWAGHSRKWLRSSPYLPLPLFYEEVAREALGEVYSGGRDVVEVKHAGMRTVAWRLQALPNFAVTLTDYGRPSIKAPQKPRSQWL